MIHGDAAARLDLLRLTDATAFLSIYVPRPTMRHLPKKPLKCRNSPPLYVECQFGQAHRRPWHINGKKSGSIRKPEQVEPGGGISVDHIISAQPGLITQM